MHNLIEQCTFACDIAYAHTEHACLCTGMIVGYAHFTATGYGKSFVYQILALLEVSSPDPLAEQVEGGVGGEHKGKRSGSSMG